MGIDDGCGADCGMGVERRRRGDHGFVYEPVPAHLQENCVVDVDSEEWCAEDDWNSSPTIPKNSEKDACTVAGGFCNGGNGLPFTQTCYVGTTAEPNNYHDETRSPARRRYCHNVPYSNVYQNGQGDNGQLTIDN